MSEFWNKLMMMIMMMMSEIEFILIDKIGVSSKRNKNFNAFNLKKRRFAILPSPSSAKKGDFDN